MKKHKKRKVAVELSLQEWRLLIKGLMAFRNKVIKSKGPTEDLDALLMKIL